MPAVSASRRSATPSSEPPDARFALSWQILPTKVVSLLSSGDPAGVDRMTQAPFQMRKLDMQALLDAYEGRES